jgi:hypothetical protein
VLSRTGEQAEFVVVSTPQKLQGVDPKNLDRVIVSNVPLMIEIAYRGDALTMELGLFSVPEADLLSPFLEVLQELSSVAGVSFLGSQTAILQPLRKGLDLLLGTASGPQLEIGLYQTWDRPKTGHYAVVRTSTTGPYTLTDDFRLQLSGAPAQESYLVFSIEASSSRHSWARIPEIQHAYRDVVGDVQRDPEAVRTSLEMFRRVAVLSPDLLAADGERLFALVEAEVRRAMPTTGTSATKTTALPSLAEIPLF